MAKSMTFNARPTVEKASETFVVKNMPENTTEAIKIFGEKEAYFGMFGTSVTVQLQGQYRNLRTRKENRLTAKNAAVVMLTAKPSAGERERLSKLDKVNRDQAKLSSTEKLAFFASIGLTEDQAKSAVKRQENAS